MFNSPMNPELYVALTPDTLASPVSVQELDLMVQMHIPEAQILQDLELRPLQCPLNGANERMLLRDGASLRLVRSLRTFLR